MNRTVTGIVVAAGALALGMSGAVAANAAAPVTYVALGDSYAAGTGAGSYISDGAGCYRSKVGYPARIATASGLSLNLQACSGATVADVSGKQLGALSTASYVTITVGGNDIGFSSVISTCLGTNTTACTTAVAGAVSKAKTVLPSKLVSLFNAVKAGSPGGATIVATNYPRLFNGKDCSLLTSFTSTEMTQLNAGADTLSDTIKAAATTAGITFADVRTPFTGHAVCDSRAWVNNASLFSSYNSFHPNATGYGSGYTPSVTTALAPVTTATTMTLKTGGTTSSDTRRGEVKTKAKG
ncbi:MAG: SGNH/GDSL hydrolase family protein [Propionicimonas sp.]